MVDFNMKISQHEVSQKMGGFVPSWPRSVISALASFTTHFIQRLCLLMFIILFPQQHSPAQPTCTSSSLYSMTQWIHSLFPVLLDLTHLPEGPSIHITSVVLWPLFFFHKTLFQKQTDHCIFYDIYLPGSLRMGWKSPGTSLYTLCPAHHERSINSCLICWVSIPLHFWYTESKSLSFS